jgi:nucleobase:cation symporter-1, NCS1 family
MTAKTHDLGGESHSGELFVVEPHGIEHIPDSERHGKPYQQGTIWFAAQINFVAVLIGSLAASFGLGFWPAVITCVAANIAGALMNSAAVAMGPRMGMPQMPMSRSAFGFVGNYLPAFLASTLFVGYFATTNIVGAETIQQIWPALPYTPAAIVLGALAITLTLYGYNLVHWIERYMSLALTAVFVVLTGLAVTHGFGPSHHSTVHGTALVEAVALQFMVIFSYTASWALYGSDFSRYLPADTPARTSYWWSFAGMLLGTCWMNIIGVYLGTLADKHGILPAIRTVSGGFADVVYIGIVFGGLMVAVINAYSGALSGITWDIPLKRPPTVVLIGAIGILLSVAFGGPKFEASLEDFLYLVAYFVSPWLTIVIVDFWLLHEGGRAYPGVGEFYRRDGLFGRIRWTGVLSFGIGVALSVPFMATVLFTGPIGKAFGGADLSYAVSAVVSGALYYVWCRQTSRSGRSTAVTDPTVSPEALR